MAGLSVDVPADEDAQAGDNGLSLGNLEEDDQNEDVDRNQYGLNSPKGDGDLADGVDGGNTPNTLRNQYGVNSPRKKGEVPQGGWGAANGNEKEDGKAGDGSGGSAPSGIEALVTQVSRDDPTQQIITQVPKDESSLKTEQTLKTQTTQQSGFCACLCGIFSCCSPSPQQAPTTTQMTQAPNTQQQASTSSIPNTKPNAPLIPSSEKEKENNGGNNDNDDDKDESYTETEYPPGLLPPLLPEHVGKKCLVLDLDETLVHSSFKPIPSPDFIIPVEIDNVVHRVYVMKRPYVDEFLVETAKDYEIVIFTASLAKYADPLLDKLDTHKTITHRLFRESCVLHGTAYVKDLRTLGRKLKDSIIVDNSPPSYLFQPINAIPILSWFDDQTDTQLRDILPCMKTTMKNIKDVRKLLDANTKSYRWLCQQANKPLEIYD